MTTRRVVPEILSAFLPTLEFPISYVATIKTIARKLYQALQHVLTGAGIYSMGMVLSAVIKDSRDFVLMKEFWLVALTQHPQEILVSSPCQRYRSVSLSHTDEIQ